MDATDVEEQEEAEDEQDEAKEQEGGGVREVGLSISSGDSRPPGGWW